MQPSRNKREKLILGTAQLGLQYGPQSSSINITQERAFEILDSSWELGIYELDTAKGYGRSHEFIGDYHRIKKNIFRVFTKITAEDFAADSNIIQSLLTELSVKQLSGVLLHRPDDALNINLVAYLKEQKQKGLIQQLGLSLYYDPSFFELITKFKPDFVQIPFNVLDNSQIRKKEFDFLKENNIQIHTRSCFLRGALLNPRDNAIPKALQPWLEEANQISINCKISPAELCLNYCVQTPLISKVLIGVDDPKQLKENISLLETNLNINVMDEINHLAINDLGLLDLRKWK